jgi:hypothetical protein
METQFACLALVLCSWCLASCSTLAPPPGARKERRK